MIQFRCSQTPIRLRVTTNKDLDFMIAIQPNKTIQQLAQRVLISYVQLAEQINENSSKLKVRDLTISAVKFDGYYITKHEIIKTLLKDYDEIECIISKAKPKYPNHPKVYAQTIKKIQEEDMWGRGTSLKEQLQDQKIQPNKISCKRKQKKDKKKKRKMAEKMKQKRELEALFIQNQKSQQDVGFDNDEQVQGAMDIDEKEKIVQQMKIQKVDQKEKENGLANVCEQKKKQIFPRTEQTNTAKNSIIPLQIGTQKQRKLTEKKKVKKNQQRRQVFQSKDLALKQNHKQENNKEKSKQKIMIPTTVKKEGSKDSSKKEGSKDSINKSISPKIVFHNSPIFTANSPIRKLSNSLVDKLDKFELQNNNQALKSSKSTQKADKSQQSISNNPKQSDKNKTPRQTQSNKPKIIIEEDSEIQSQIQIIDTFSPNKNTNKPSTENTHQNNNVPTTNQLKLAQLEAKLQKYDFNLDASDDDE